MDGSENKDEREQQENQPASQYISNNFEYPTEARHKFVLEQWLPSIGPQIH